MKTDTHGGAAVASRAARSTDPAPSFGEYQFHPLVMAFPRLSAEQLDDLADDIRRRGAAAPILKHGEIILDDFNRCAACKLAGVPIIFREWDGSGSLAEVVAKAILPRAHFTESQRAAIAVPISDHLAGQTVAAGIATGRGNLRNAKTAFPANGSVAAQVQQPTMTESCSLDFKVGDRVFWAHPDMGDDGEWSETGSVLGLKRGPFSSGQKITAVFVEWDLRSGEKKKRSGHYTTQIRKMSDAGTAAVKPAESVEEKRLGRAAEIAAQLCQVSPRYVYEARKLRDADRDLFNQVRLGQINLSAARIAVSKLDRNKKLPAINGDAIKRSQTDGDELIVGDCLGKMATMRDGVFDLVFADPPYNLGWKYDADPTHDLLPDARYYEWTERWIKHCARLLAPAGSMFVMIDSRWQGRFDVILRNAGLHWRNTLVWHDTFPNNTDKRFQPAARFIHYFTRSPKNFAFNADAVRVPSRRDEIGDARRVHDKGIVPHDVWDCPRVAGNSDERVPFDDSPPQVPAIILDRIILAASNAGDRVFDPFTGNGTTWRSARKHGRKFTGIERSAKYAGQARQWAMGRGAGESTNLHE